MQIEEYKREAKIRMQNMKIRQATNTLAGYSQLRIFIHTSGFVLGLIDLPTTLVSAIVTSEFENV